MANTRQVQVVTAPTQAYAQAERKRALADALQQRSMKPRDMSYMQGADPYLSGLTQIAEALVARNQGKKAAKAEGEADSQMQDTNRAAIEKLAGAYQFEGLDDMPATQIAGGSLPGTQIETALAGTDPRQANQVVAKALLEKAMPVQLDPDKAAQRELTREQIKATQENQRLTLEQRATEAEMRASNAALDRDARAQAAKDANAIRVQLGQMSADSARYAADARRDAAMAKIDNDRKTAPGSTSPEAAVGFLQNAGYDAATGEDDITKLLAVATGGLLERGRDAGARMFNETTDGAKASAALKSRASEAVLDFLGGKLGAGVSNADRDFMMERAGDIGNAKLSTGERRAAWLDVRGRMERVAAAGTPAPAAPAAAAPAAPAGSSSAPPPSLLKEGVVTTFANGQGWTLRGGQPVQVK